MIDYRTKQWVKIKVNNRPAGFDTTGSPNWCLMHKNFSFSDSNNFKKMLNKMQMDCPFHIKTKKCKQWGSNDNKTRSRLVFVRSTSIRRTKLSLKTKKNNGKWLVSMHDISVVLIQLAQLPLELELYVEVQVAGVARIRMHRKLAMDLLALLYSQRFAQVEHRLLPML